MHTVSNSMFKPEFIYVINTNHFLDFILLNRNLFRFFGPCFVAYFGLWICSLVFGCVFRSLCGCIF